jgi:hypothetical protein
VAAARSRQAATPSAASAAPIGSAMAQAGHDRDGLIFTAPGSPVTVNAAQ